MVGLAGLVALLGYSLLYYGLDQVSGGNNSFFALINPFKPFTPAPKDGGGTGNAAPASINTGPVNTTTGGTYTSKPPKLPPTNANPQNLRR